MTLNKILNGLSLMVLAALAPAGAHADSLCDAVPGNLIQNCGFELGTVGGAPVDWSVDAGFDFSLGNYNRVITGAPSFFINSGNNALQFGNYDYEGEAGIFQTVSDTVGDIYQVDFYALDGDGPNSDSNAFLESLINGAVEVDLTGGSDAPGVYTEYQYDFTGTGSDTLGFEAQTNPNEWYLDDVSVVDTGTSSAAPEPSSLAMIIGAALLAASLSRKFARTD